MSEQITAKQFADELRLAQRVLTKTRSPQEFADIMNYDEAHVEDIIEILTGESRQMVTSQPSYRRQVKVVNKWKNKSHVLSTKNKPTKTEVINALKKSATKVDARNLLGCKNSAFYKLLNEYDLLGVKAAGVNSKPISSDEKGPAIGEQELYVEAVLKGKTLEEMARHFNCHRVTVCNYLKKYKTRTTKKFKHKETVRIVKDIPPTHNTVQ